MHPHGQAARSVGIQPGGRGGGVHGLGEETPAHTDPPVDGAECRSYSMGERRIGPCEVWNAGDNGGGYSGYQIKCGVFERVMQNESSSSPVIIRCNAKSNGSSRSLKS